MKALAPFFLSIALLGFVVVTAIHLFAIAGNTGPFQKLEPFLFPWLAAVWIPMIFIMNQINRGFAQKDVWKAALRGGRSWLKKALFLVWGYAGRCVHGNDLHCKSAFRVFRRDKRLRCSYGILCCRMRRYVLSNPRRRSG